MSPEKEEIISSQSSEVLQLAKGHTIRASKETERVQASLVKETELVNTSKRVSGKIDVIPPI